MRVDAVVFDMDGLMIDTEAPVQACCQMAASEMGFTLDDEFYVDALVGRGWDDCYEALSARFGPVFSISEFVRRFNDKWKLHLRAGIEVKPGLRELLAMLRSRCVPIAVATSTDSDEAKASLASARLTETFNAFVTGDQVKCGKPDPEIYLTAAACLGVSPRACVALEDSSPGALAASRAGMTTLLIPDGGRTPTAEASQAAFRVLPSLREARQLLEEWLNTC